MTLICISSSGYHVFSYEELAWKFADFNIYHLRDNVGTGFVQLQVVNALWKGDRQLASKMLLDLGEVNDKLSAKDFACILEYCARTPDPLVIIMDGNS